MIYSKIIGIAIVQKLRKWDVIMRYKEGQQLLEEGTMSLI